MPDIFETHFITAADKPALVAVSNPAWLETAKKVLKELGYKVHAAATHQEFTTRFSQARYQVVILDELFDAGKPEENLTLKSLQMMPVNQRRHATIILFGNSFKTFDADAGFPAKRPRRHQRRGNPHAQAARRKSRGRERPFPLRLPRRPEAHFLAVKLAGLDGTLKFVV